MCKRRADFAIKPLSLALEFLEFTSMTLYQTLFFIVLTRKMRVETPTTIPHVFETLSIRGRHVIRPRPELDLALASLITTSKAVSRYTVRSSITICSSYCPFIDF